MQQLQKTTLTSLLAHYEPLVIAGLVFVAHLVLRAADRILVGAFNDDGAYVALGQALAGGVGYRLIYLVGDPVAVKYPPGLPLLIAVPWKLFGTLAGVRATIGLLNPWPAAQRPGSSGGSDAAGSTRLPPCSGSAPSARSSWMRSSNTSISPCPSRTSFAGGLRRCCSLTAWPTPGLERRGLRSRRPSGSSSHCP